MVTREQVIEVLKTIEDPELFLDIWFLGLIYDISIAEDTISIEMTFTTPNCPAGPDLVYAVRDKLSKLEGVEDVVVKVVFTPPWEPSDEVKGLLGFL